MARSTARAIVVHKACILLMERWRKDPKTGQELHYFSLPGGRIEPGETPEAAVVREVFEEMGVIVRPMCDIKTWPRPNGGENHYFVCAYESGEPQLTASSPEAQRTRQGNRYQPQWVSRAQFAKTEMHADYEPLRPIIEDIFDNKMPPTAARS